MLLVIQVMSRLQLGCFFRKTDKIHQEMQKKTDYQARYPIAHNLSCWINSLKTKSPGLCIVQIY